MPIPPQSIVWLTIKEVETQHRLLQYALDHSIQPDNLADHRALASFIARALRDFGCTQTDDGWEIPEGRETAEIMMGLDSSDARSVRMLWAELAGDPATAVDAATVGRAYRESIARERAKFGPADPGPDLTL